MELKKGKPGPKSQYDPALKRKICEELLSGKTYVRAVARKYNVKSAGTILQWLKKYEEEQNQIVSSACMDAQKQDNPGEEIKSDQQNPEEALRLAKLKIAGLEAMIDIAEQTFNIDIRKKSGTKQSSE